MSAEVEDPLSNGHLNGTTPEPADAPDLAMDDDLKDDDEDLFGDDDDDEQIVGTRPSQRKLDDEELDSGDDEGRVDRVADTIEDEGQELEPTKLLSADIARIKYPADSEDLYFLSMPPYLGMKHRNYDPTSYEPPTLPHDGVDPAIDPTRKFSAYSTATTSMFWRRDPKNPELLQSNARIVRWSDGSMTLQLASRPTEHYRINTTAVRQKPKPGQTYELGKDSHMYLAAGHRTDGIDLQIIRPIDATMKIQPTGEQADESVQRLKQSLAAQQAAHDPLKARFKKISEDPELAKKAAEAFEKDKARAMRKREAAEDRLLLKRDRVLGRSGMGGGRSAGLSIAGLEDDDGMPSTKSKKRRRPNRRGDIYSDDEDPDAPRARTREDEYDREDDFLASSDEEPEVYDSRDEEEVLAGSDDDPDRDDLEIEGRQTVIEDRTRGGGGSGATKSLQKPKKRSRMDEIEDQGDDEDDDAEGEEDTELLRRQSAAGEGSPGGVAGTGRRRRVIDDDEDDDE